MELLVMAVDKINDDPALDLGAAKIGDIIQTYPDGALREEPAPIPPNGNGSSVIVKVPGLAQDETHAAEWHRLVDYTVVSSDLATDTHRLRVAAAAGEFNPTNGEGKLTLEMVESYLTTWGCTVMSVADNAVTFDAKILTVIQSPRFWERGVAGVTFTETGYVQASGTHTVRADYSATAWPSAAVADAVLLRGGTITTHNTSTKRITFTITRTIVRQAFQDDVKAKVRTMLRKRKYHLDRAWVQALAAGERWTTILPSAYLGLLKNRTTD